MIATLLSLLFIAHDGPNSEVHIEQEDLGFVQIDPSLHWQTLKTKYFAIHYHSETERVARELTRIADTIYDHHVQQFRTQTRLPIQVVLINSLDQANGFATPFPYNTIVLYVTLPDDGSSLDEYDQWLTMLFTHELTHTVHVDMAHGVNRFFRSLFGSIVIPNSTQPQWIIEGIAMYNETTLTKAGRGRSSYIDMYFRDAAARDDLLPIERALYWNDEFPFGQAPYWYGIRFHQWIAKKYGERKWFDFAQKNSRFFFALPGWFNFKTASIFGKSFDRLWEEWKLEESAAQKKILQSYSPQFKSQAFRPPTSFDPRHPFYMNGAFAWDSTQQHLYASVSQRGRDSLLRWQRNENSFGEAEIVRPNFSSGRPNIQDGVLYYSKQASVGAYKKYADLHAYDLKTKKEKRITRGFRIKDIHLFERTALAIRSNAFQSSLVRLQLPPADKIFAPDWRPIEDLSALEVLYTGEGFDNLSFPSISPDRNQIVFSMHREGFGRDLFLLNLNSREVQALTQDSYLDYYPQFSEDGQFVYFVSDRELANTKTRVFNLYAYELSSGRLQAITDTWAGVFWPLQIGSQFAAGEFTREGFVPKIVSASITPQAGAALERQNFVRETPPILAKAPKEPPQTPARDYDTGSTLLPHFVLPFGFYTESDSLIGLLTGSRDPLGIHSWQALAYHYITRNRPGGTLSYAYDGLKRIRLSVAGGATIGNYGAISLVSQPNGNLSLNDYYEREYFGQIGLSLKEINSSWRAGVFASYADRRPLLPKPNNLIESNTDLDALPTAPQLDFLRNSKFNPEKGQQVTLGTRIGFGTSALFDIDGIGPRSGKGISLGIDYSPKVLGGDFQTLITSLQGQYYLEMARDFQLALSASAGMQWLDRLYLSSFRLGGSTSNFARGSRSFILRGLSEGELRGEGLIATSLEFRFPILKRMPGFGTAPIWLKNIHFGVFSDVGQTFVKNREGLTVYDRIREAQDPLFRTETHQISATKFTQSVGAELRTDVSFIYAPPLTLRLGYGHVLLYQGKNQLKLKFGDQKSQFYFQAGASF